MPITKGLKMQMIAIIKLNCLSYLASSHEGYNYYIKVKFR